MVDGGWAWFVVLASFGIHVTTSAMAKCFGILLVDFQERFQCSTWALTTVQGTSIALWLGIAPLSNALAVRFTCRAVVFSGGILGTIGFVGSSLAPTLPWFFVSQGIVVGIGYGLAYAPSVFMVAMYFDKKRGLAMSIAQSGVGFGSIIVPVVIRHCVSEYGLRGSVLLQGAFMANICVFAMLLRPIPVVQGAEVVVDVDEVKMVLQISSPIDTDETDSVHRKTTQLTLAVNTDTNKDKFGSDYLRRKALLVDGQMASVGDNSLRDKSTSLTLVDKSDPIDKYRQQFTETMAGHELQKIPKLTHNLCPPERHITRSETHINKLLPEKLRPKFHASNMSIVNRKVSSQRHIHDIGVSSLNIHASSRTIANSRPSSHIHIHETGSSKFNQLDFQCEENTRTNCCTGNGKCTRYFQWSLFCNPIFVIYFIGAVASALTWEVSYTLLSSLAIDRRFSRYDASLLPSMLGFADFVARLAIGPVSDLNIIPRRYIFSFSVVMTGVNAMFVPFTTSYTTLAICSVFYGILGAFDFVLAALVLADVLGAEKCPSAYGFVSLFQAIGISIIAQIIGTLHDLTGSWYVSFWFTASLSIVGGLLSFMEPAVRPCKQKCFRSTV